VELIFVLPVYLLFRLERIEKPDKCRLIHLIESGWFAYNPHQ
jgi:hypothetical protein